MKKLRKLDSRKLNSSQQKKKSYRTESLYHEIHLMMAHQHRAVRIWFFKSLC